MFDRSEINYQVIDNNILDSLDLWGMKGIEPGGFLKAVLENNLMQAIGRADYRNRKVIFEICLYVQNQLPNACFGSPEAVEKWEGLPDEVAEKYLRGYR